MIIGFSFTSMIIITIIFVIVINNLKKIKMSEKEYSNEFRFSLHQENVLLCEKVFNADQFNPFTRYSIDIRDILPRGITKLQKVLSKLDIALR
jgi:hypothetical protein